MTNVCAGTIGARVNPRYGAKQRQSGGLRKTRNMLTESNGLSSSVLASKSLQSVYFPLSRRRIISTIDR
jgi:hypothetical protein